MAKTTGKQSCPTWSEEYRAILQRGFQEKKLRPELVKGKEINAELKSNPEIFQQLRPFFFPPLTGV